MTYYSMTVVNNCCSHTRITAKSREELWKKFEDGRAAGWWSSIIGTEEHEGVDWEKEHQKVQAWLKAKLDGTWHDELPETDAVLLEQANALPDEEWDKIDPDAGILRPTRMELERIQREKRGRDFHRNAVEKGWIPDIKGKERTPAAGSV